MGDGSGAAGSHDGGAFGSWATDDEGLPCFDYELLARPAKGGAKAGRADTGLVLPDGGPRAAWHLLSNPVLKATAHAGGWLTIFATSRGFVRMTGGQSPCRQWQVVSASGERLVDPGSDACAVRARFGMGYAEWSATQNGVTVVRRACVAGENLPVLRIDTSVGAAPPGAELREDWRFSPYPIALGGLMTKRVLAYSRGPLRERAIWEAIMAGTTTMRLATDAGRSLAAAALMRMRAKRLGELNAVVAEPVKKRDPKSERALFDPWAPLAFVAVLDPARGAAADVRGSAANVRSPADTPASLAIGIVRTQDEIEAAVAAASRASRAAAAAAHRPVWALSHPGDPALEREAIWHAHYLRGLEVADDYFERRYPMQGSAYSFIHGLQGAPRDYAISAAALSHVDPPAAREAIEVIMMMTRSNGSMQYAHTGYGKCVSAVIHESPSDLPIFLLWALCEYAGTSGDKAFLDAEIPFYPRERGESSTVEARVRLAFERLRDSVGLGAHGMLRVGSGDWSDPISAMAPSRKAFHEGGESGFNTSFAAYALPQAAALIEDRDADLAREMRAFAAGLADAMAEAFNGRWFLRGWDGTGGPIGDEYLFLDGQVWCLIGELGSAEDRATLVEEIRERLIEPSPIGATILDRPHPIRFGILPPGWDCNGGVWAAINSLLAWGLAAHDRELATDCLRRQMLAAHAAAYPEIWYGIWSGPDAYNAHFGERAGETFVQPATPMAEYPVMNSNAHAGPLLALAKVAGIEQAARRPRRHARGGKGAPSAKGSKGSKGSTA